MISKVDYERRLVAGLEIFIWGLKENAGAPVIFFAHGLAGSVHNVSKYCADLANNGFIAIALNQRNHGNRTVDPAAYCGEVADYTVKSYGTYLGTSQDISLIIDFLPSALGTTTDRIGMSGISLGGHCTLITMANDPRIMVGVPFIGSADRKLQLEIRAGQKGISKEEFEHSFCPHLDALMKKYDAVHKLEEFKNRALCMINGGMDPVVDCGPNKHFKQLLDLVYTEKDKLCLSIYPDAGHEVTADMWDEAQQWFARYLKES